MLHSKKSQSILQWFNSLTAKGDVNSLVQFTDGSHFYEIVASLQPFYLQGSEGDLAGESVIVSETSIAGDGKVIAHVQEEAAVGKLERSVSQSGNADPFAFKDSDNTDTHKKYDVIKKFINEFYHVESSLFIDYGECQNGKELELAKVAVFLLSAMVQNFLSSEDKVVYNTTLLEPEVQENIRECLSLVLVEKDMGENQIQKSELHKILGRPASYKGTPIRKQPSRSISDPNDLSDGGKNVPKKRKERRSVVYENIQDSPLKNLLESPKIQYKAAIFKKESELAKLRGALHNEENKVMDLTLEQRNLNDELEKRKKELEFYKKELESQREAFCEKEKQESLRAEELKNKKIEEERVRKIIETQEEEIKQLQENNEALQGKIVDIEEKLGKDATSSLIEENNNLKKKIQLLELDNEKKSETIKTLNEKVANLELKIYQQMLQEFSTPSSRRELRSPNVPETLSTIIYADEQSSREKLERKEQELRQDLETKDERIKLLALQQRKGDMSKTKNRNIESLQYYREKKMLKEKREYCESKLGPTTGEAPGIRDMNSVKSETDRIGSVFDDVSEISASCNKKDGQLWANVSDDSQHSKKDISDPMGAAKIAFERSVLLNIIRILEKKNCVASFLAKTLKENCSKIKDSNGQSACLRDLLQALKLPVEPSVTTRSSRSLAAEEVDVNSLINKNKNLEQEIQMLRQKSRNKTNKKEDELKMAIRTLEVSNTVLMKEIENLKQELAITQEKYISAENRVKKKESYLKKSMIMYQNVVQLKNKYESKKLCGEECGKLQRKVKELSDECQDSEQEISMLKYSLKNAEGQLQNLNHKIKELTNENKELKYKLYIEKSALSDNIVDRDAVVDHFLSQSKHEAPETAKDMQLRKYKQKNSLRPGMNFNRYMLKTENELSTSNSVFASSSIRSGFFQAADEDDFLNESSLAEIHNGGIPEGASGESRLQEIRRRNTLCLPHLQSSYPLEIQNMTPSEKKYYDPEQVSFDLGRKSSLHKGKRDFRKNPKSKYMDNDSDDSDDSDSFPVRKRKVAETDCMSIPVAKKQCRPTAKIIGPKEKSSTTPLKRVADFVRRQSTFKTPISVHRLMRMPRKSKAR